MAPRRFEIANPDNMGTILPLTPGESWLLTVLLLAAIVTVVTAAALGIRRIIREDRESRRTPPPSGKCGSPGCRCMD